MWDLVAIMSFTSRASQNLGATHLDLCRIRAWRLETSSLLGLVLSKGARKMAKYQPRQPQLNQIIGISQSSLIMQRSDSLTNSSLARAPRSMPKRLKKPNVVMKML